MAVEQSFYNVLSSASAVTAVAGTNIFPATLPTDPVLPALTYSFIGGSVLPNMSTRGVQRSRVQIDCFASTYNSAVSLRDAVIQTLAGYSSAAFSSQILSTSDDFDHSLLQYRAIVEVYVTYSL